MYFLDVKPLVDKVFSKLSKKNPLLLKKIGNKILEICSQPNHEYKFLRGPLKSFNRVHIDDHFVLIFQINHKEKIVTIFYFDHHDKAYKWKPKE